MENIKHGRFCVFPFTFGNSRCFRSESEEKSTRSEGFHRLTNVMDVHLAFRFTECILLLSVAANTARV